LTGKVFHDTRSFSRSSLGYFMRFIEVMVRLPGYFAKYFRSRSGTFPSSFYRLIQKSSGPTGARGNHQCNANSCQTTAEAD